MARKYAFIDTERCVACGACENACIKGTVRIHHGCYAKVEVESCVGCGLCKKACPVGCIDLKERRQQ